MNKRIFNFIQTRVIRNSCLIETSDLGWCLSGSMSSWPPSTLLSLWSLPTSIAVEVKFLEDTFLPSPFTVHLWTCHLSLCLILCSAACTVSLRSLLCNIFQEITVQRTLLWLISNQFCQVPPLLVFIRVNSRFPFSYPSP